MFFVWLLPSIFEVLDSSNYILEGYHFLPLCDTRWIGPGCGRCNTFAFDFSWTILKKDGLSAGEKSSWMTRYILCGWFLSVCLMRIIFAHGTYDFISGNGSAISSSSSAKDECFIIPAIATHGNINKTAIINTCKPTNANIHFNKIFLVINDYLTILQTSCSWLRNFSRARAGD